MDVERKSFLLYKNMYAPIKHLSNTDLGKLLRALFEYNLEEKKVNGFKVDPEIRIAFEFFRNAFEMDDEKYQKKVKASRENGSKGGRPPKPEEPTGLSSPPKKPDIDIVIDIDKDIEIEKDIDKDLKEKQVKEIFENWWKFWKGNIKRDNPGNKAIAKKEYKKWKLKPEQIIKATRNYLKATGAYHKDAERFLRLSDGLVKQHLEDEPQKPLSQVTNREIPIEPNLKNHIDVLRREIRGMTKPQLSEIWEKIPDYLREKQEVQKMFADKM